MEILITSNSPGEVASWLRVTVPALRRRLPEAIITVALVPCPYATGVEKSVVEKLPGVDEVLSPWETVRLVQYPHRRPSLGGRRRGPGLVFFLGGDPWHALLLAYRLGYKVGGYFHKPGFWSRRFDFPLFCRATTDSPGAQVVGDLMVDGLTSTSPQERVSLGLSDDRPVLALFPGSRSWHLRVTLAAYVSVVERVMESRPRVNGKPWFQCILVRSPFVDEAGLQKAIDNPWALGVPVARVKAAHDMLVAESGLTIPVVTGLPGEVFPLFDFAMTIPGTNTAELACAAKPFLVTLHKRAFVGGGGLAGLLERIPFLPESWNIKLRQMKLARLRFTSHPNMIAQRIVAPEVMAGADTVDLEQELIYWLEDAEGRHALGLELQSIMGQPGAAERLAEEVAGYLATL